MTQEIRFVEIEPEFIEIATQIHFTRMYPRRRGLYDDKCEECTTGVSCEEAKRCLFEG